MTGTAAYWPRLRTAVVLVAALVSGGLAAAPAVAATAGVVTNLVSEGTLLADGSVIADTSTVTIGTSALLNPGVDTRTLMTTFDTATPYVSGTAVAPEGWTLEYTTNGSTWTSVEPSPASSVTAVRAVKGAVAAGGISGSSQVYSSQTTSQIPATNFTGSTGGDGWDVFFSEDNVFNVFHHNAAAVVLDCHARATGSRCTGWTSAATFSGYITGMDSSGWYDSLSGHVYVITVRTASPATAGALCIDVSRTGSMPTSCGFTALSSATASTVTSNLGMQVNIGRKLLGISAATHQLVCFDAATNASCSDFPLTDSAIITGVEGSYNRLVSDGTHLFFKTNSSMRCFLADLSPCSGWTSAGVAITSVRDTPIAIHQDTNGDTDGICFYNSAGNAAQSCLNMAGSFESNWQSPFNWSGSQLDRGDPFDGASTLGRYYWAGIYNQTITCYDFATNAGCATGTGGWNNYTNATAGVNLNWAYSVRVDPSNPYCLWLNSDAGAIRTFDAMSGHAGCAEHPAITLQPSQFAPRYACSTTSGIQQWTNLTLDSIAGGGSASSVTLTVRDASGVIVSGWRNVPVTLGSTLDMSGLNVGASGSRPTFSFQFSGVSGTLSSSVISLDYLGAGPELCARVSVNAQALDMSTACPQVSFNSALTDGSMPYVNTRSLGVSTTGSSCSAGYVQQSVPGAPVSLTASGSNTTALLHYSPPTSNGGLAISQYVVSIDNGATWRDASPQPNGDGTFTTTLTGLTAGQTYQMQVAAINAMGRGASASVSVLVQLATITSLADVPLNTGSIYFTETSTHGTTMSYSTSTSAVCAMTDTTTLSLVSVGLCSITAFSAGDDQASPVILPETSTASFQVLANPATAPGAPTGLVLTSGNAQLTAAWSAPASNGGAAITDYVVQYQYGANWVPFTDGVNASTGVVIVGLTNGQNYPVRVAAVNSVGQGPWSSVVSGVPANITVPGAVTGLASSRTDSSTTTSTLTFTAPTSNGGSSITDYAIEYKDRLGTTWSPFTHTASTAVSVAVTGLTAGVEYDFRVAAVNTIGAGAWVSTSTLQATSADASLLLTWTSPLTGGESLDHYLVQYRVAGGSVWLDGDTTTSTTNTLSGLTNAVTYEVRVAAITSTSTSSYTSVITETPNRLSAPETPTAVTAVASAAQILLSWTAPADNGLAITDYVVQYRAVGAANWITLTDGVSTLTRALILNLTNGTTYEVTVAAKNSAGTGSASTPVTATPATLPGAPATISSYGGPERVTATWTAPANDGGSVITGYRVQYKLLSASQWIDLRDTTDTLTSVTGLTANTQYSVRVAAINAVGLGAYATTAARVDAACVAGTGESLTVSDVNRCYSTTATRGADNGGNTVGVSVTLPSGSQTSSMLLQITDLTASNNLAKGLPYYRITAVDSATGTTLTTFQRPLTIVLLGSSNAVPMVSSDSGTTWRALVLRTIDEVALLGATGDGYQVSGGTFTIYTMHLTDWALQGPGTSAPASSSGGSVTPLNNGNVTIVGPDALGVIRCVAPKWNGDVSIVTVTWTGVVAATATLTSAPWESAAQLPDGFNGPVTCRMAATGPTGSANLATAATLRWATAPAIVTAPVQLAFKKRSTALGFKQTSQLIGLLKTNPTAISATVHRVSKTKAATRLMKKRWKAVRAMLNELGYTGTLHTTIVNGGTKITLSHS